MTFRILSGMRPTGNLHLGNYFGAIRQFLDLQEKGDECFFFVADVHALTEVTRPTDVDELSLEVAKNYLACGIDPERSVLYRQSDVPEVSEIAVLLGNTVNIGRLQTCTTFKDRVQNKGVEEGEVSYGLLGYPVLMAADILAVRADRVPVGRDQIQHIEMARDFARSFNVKFGSDTFVIPVPNEVTPIKVPGIDGKEKMGKSDGNAIALLEGATSLRKKVMGIPTQSELTDEMQPGTQALYALMELCSPPDVTAEFRARYERREEKFFGAMKLQLFGDITALLAPIQERYHALQDQDVLRALELGAARVRPIAAAVLADMRHAMGLKRRKEGL